MSAFNKNHKEVKFHRLKTLNFHNVKKYNINKSKNILLNEQQSITNDSYKRESINSSAFNNFMNNLARKSLFDNNNLCKLPKKLKSANKILQSQYGNFLSKRFFKKNEKEEKSNLDIITLYQNLKFGEKNNFVKKHSQSFKKLKLGKRFKIESIKSDNLKIKNKNFDIIENEKDNNYRKKFQKNQKRKKSNKINKEEKKDKEDIQSKEKSEKVVNKIKNKYFCCLKVNDDDDN